MEKTIYTNPTPSVGGTLITFTLQLLEKAQTASNADMMDLVQAAGNCCCPHGYIYQTE